MKQIILYFHHAVKQHVLSQPAVCQWEFHQTDNHFFLFKIYLYKDSYHLHTFILPPKAVLYIKYNKTYKWTVVMPTMLDLNCLLFFKVVA